MRHVSYSIASLLVLLSLVLAGTSSAARAGQAGSRAAAGGTLTVFAASSLTAAFTTIGAAFDKANNATVKFNFASSDALVTQMAQGAPADVFAVRQSGADDTGHEQRVDCRHAVRVRAQSTRGDRAEATIPPTSTVWPTWGGPA